MNLSLHYQGKISHVHNCYLKVFITIAEVRGFLFAITMQHPKSTAWVSSGIVSELAEQSTRAKPMHGKSQYYTFVVENMVRQVNQNEKQCVRNSPQTC